MNGLKHLEFSLCKGQEGTRVREKEGAAASAASSETAAPFSLIP